MIKELFAVNVFDGQTILKNQLIQAEHGKILSLTTMDAPQNVPIVQYLSPGFIDLQINGGNKTFFTQKPTVESVKDIDLSCNTLGTVWTLPTLTTSPVSNIKEGINAIRIFRENHPNTGVLGMHLEGPFISPENAEAILQNMYNNQLMMY